MRGLDLLALQCFLARDAGVEEAVLLCEVKCYSKALLSTLKAALVFVVLELKS